MDNKQARKILDLMKVAKCPADCDNGSIPYGPDDNGTWGADQCQFCHERGIAISALEGRGEGEATVTSEMYFSACECWHSSAKTNGDIENAVKAALDVQPKTMSEAPEFMRDVRMLISTLTDSKAKCPGRHLCAVETLRLLDEWLESPTTPKVTV